MSAQPNGHKGHAYHDGHKGHTKRVKPLATVIANHIEGLHKDKHDGRCPKCVR